MTLIEFIEASFKYARKLIYAKIETHRLIIFGIDNNIVRLRIGHGKSIYIVIKTLLDKVYLAPLLPNFRPDLPMSNFTYPRNIISLEIMWR